MAVEMQYGAPTPKIAIIGLEGSGKTVLITTLAKRFSVPAGDRIFISPQNVETLTYIEKNWAILQSGQWPRSTFTGEMIDLTWKLHRPSGAPCELRMVDVSGQVLRQIFSQDPAKRDAPLTGHLAKVDRYCREADIIILLLNIRDFVGESDADRRLANQTALYSAIQQMNPRDEKQVAVVFTQFDRYQALVEQYGGLNNFLMHEVSHIFGAHVHGKPTMTMSIAAVCDTTTYIDENGTTMLLPRPGFRSQGLTGFMRWLEMAIESQGKVRRRTVSATTPPPRQTRSGSFEQQARTVPPPRKAHSRPEAEDDEKVPPKKSPVVRMLSSLFSIAGVSTVILGLNQGTRLNEQQICAAVALSCVIGLIFGWRQERIRSPARNGRRAALLALTFLIAAAIVGIYVDGISTSLHGLSYLATRFIAMFCLFTALASIAALPGIFVSALLAKFK